MAHSSTCHAAWLELVADVLQGQPGARGFPHARVAGLLIESFDAACCSYNVVDPAWVDHVAGGWPVGHLPTTPPLDVRPDATTQPLIRWYAVTGSPAAQILSRVPRDVAPDRMAAEWADVARPLGIAHQLALPLRVDDGLEGYVVCRPDDDYADADADLAARVLPALAALFRHHRALLGAPEERCARAGDLHLTEREFAVLRLLGAGLTAEAIGRRLRTSPRTVHKHLEHLYRKLGVRDRLMAVQRARDAGLLTTPPPPGARPGARSGARRAGAVVPLPRGEQGSPAAPAPAGGPAR